MSKKSLVIPAVGFTVLTGIMAFSTLGLAGLAFDIWKFATAEIVNRN